MATKYPTKEEILEEEQMYKAELLTQIREWKKEIWFPARTKTDEEKFEALKALVQIMATAYNKPVKVKFTPDMESCCYIPAVKTICINKTLSIISTMHEFGHHLYGSSELEACKYSVWLFSKTFKTAYKRLEWNGHMLVKANPLRDL